MKLAIQSTAIIAMLVIAGIFAWGFVEPYFLMQPVEEFDLPNYDGPQLRFTQLSDFQTGMWMDNEATVKTAVKQLVENPPDAVLITGDFLYHEHKNEEDSTSKVVGFLEPLQEAQIPVYAVLGNHDYALTAKNQSPHLEQADRLEEQLESIGVIVLDNSQTKHEEITIVGIGSEWANRSDPYLALAGLTAQDARIVLMHHPDTYADIDANQAPLALAGHTHGGQVRIPFFPQSTWMTFAKGEEVHADGWIEEEYGEAGNNLYVNRGIGFSEMPMRINAAPEMTHFIIT